MRMNTTRSVKLGVMYDNQHIVCTIMNSVQRIGEKHLKTSQIRLLNFYIELVGLAVLDMRAEIAIGRPDCAFRTQHGPSRTRPTKHGHNGLETRPARPATPPKGLPYSSLVFVVGTRALPPSVTGQRGVAGIAQCALRILNEEHTQAEAQSRELRVRTTRVPTDHSPPRPSIQLLNRE